MKYFENEGALFRGEVRVAPKEFWSFKEKAWKPYASAEPKAVDWGSEVSEAEAKAMQADGVAA